MIFNKKLIKYFFCSIFLIEYFSLIGHIYPLVNNIGFFIVVALFFAISIYNIEYGLYVVLSELFIGSFGRLFAINVFGFSLSIRIALWFVFLLIWFTKEIINLRKNKGELKSIFCIKSDNNQVLYTFFALFIFVFLGIINGFLNQPSISQVFLDFNGWLYFALLFPIFKIFENKKNIETLLQIIIYSAIWISLKTFFILFIFSHNSSYLALELYAWIRDTRIGEITRMQGGFFRVFMQSHIFVIVAFFLVLSLLTKNYLQDNKKFNKHFFLHYFLVIIFSAVNLVSLSRSNWLGILFGLLLFGFYLLYNYGFKKSFLVCLIIFSSGILSVGLIVATVKFPYPNPMAGFSTSQLLSERAKQLSGEAGVSSRWSLLNPLWNEIKTAPFFGKGFGATVTYKSSDPRVLEANPSGLYTTSAFEWGWLDIWLKIGFFGVLAYLSIFILLSKIIIKTIFLNKKNFSEKGELATTTPALFIGLAVIALINTFSPYMNHPLGIGYLLIVTAMVVKIEE